VPTREDDAELERLLREHLDELVLHRFSKSNVQLAARVLHLLFFHLNETDVHDVREVEVDHLVSFALGLGERKTPAGKPLSLGTQSTYVAAVKRFFAFLDRRSVLLQNPAEHLRLPRARRLPRFVPTRKEMERVLELPPLETSLGVRDRAVLELFYGTGIRMGECRALDVDDLDLQKQTLFVRSGKGRKDRVVPVPRKTLHAVDRYLHDARPLLLHDPKERALFVCRLGRRLGVAMLGRLIKDYGTAAGIPRLHAHALRHACATHLLQGGADIAHVQRILGHSQITTTAAYAKVVIEDLQNVVRKKHPRERQYRRKK